MTSTASDFVDVAVSIVRQTDRAVCVTDGVHEVWLPLSQIEVRPAAGGKVSGTVIISLPEWLAAERGLL